VSTSLQLFRKEADMRPMGWVVAFAGVGIAVGCEEDGGGSGVEDTDVEDTDVEDDTDAEAAAEAVDCDLVTPDAEVAIGDDYFDPDELAIEPGDVVRWTHTGSAFHTVTNGAPGDLHEGELFDSGTLEGGDTFCVRFNAAESFTYHCGFHLAEMVASIDAS
jgi:plastocyanin